MTISVVYNDKSGNAKKRASIAQAFKKHHEEPEFVALRDANANSKIKAACKKRGATIVAAGGDGTVSFVAGLVQGTQARMGVIPYGTLNHFAKDLAIPLDTNKAIATIVAGKTQATDSAMVNGRSFVNNSSMGLYPRSLTHRKRYREKIGNLPAAILSLGRVILRPYRYEVSLKIGNQHIQRRTPFVFIGNNAYDFSARDFGTRKNVHDGQLAVYVVKADSPWRVMRMFAHVLFTSKRRTPDFEVFLTPACIIRAKRHKQLNVALDGELARLKTPLRYTVKPKSMRVIVP